MPIVIKKENLLEAWLAGFTKDLLWNTDKDVLIYVKNYLGEENTDAELLEAIHNVNAKKMIYFHEKLEAPWLR